MNFGIQNANESLHNMIRSKGPKKIFVSKDRVKHAVIQAICEFNNWTLRTVRKTQKTLNIPLGKCSLDLGSESFLDENTDTNGALGGQSQRSYSGVNFLRKSPKELVALDRQEDLFVYPHVLAILDEMRHREDRSLNQDIVTGGVVTQHQRNDGRLEEAAPCSRNNLRCPGAFVFHSGQDVQSFDREYHRDGDLFRLVLSTAAKS
ncbi:hypothetical protein TNCV_3899861 [Trichonephila clavipes]|nr:hypothetical protein TNCV_3899861 [Trichonephila clavipes]